jgi:hypothetical protein
MEAIKKERYPQRYRSMAKGGLVEHLADGGMAGEEEQQLASNMPQMPSSEEQIDSIRSMAESRALSPEQQQIQNLYNIDVASKHMGDPVSLQKAQMGVQAEKLAAAEKQQRGAQDIAEQNALRAQVGLAPLPIPPELSPAALQPSVTPVSAQIAQDASPGMPPMAAQGPMQGPALEPKGRERLISGMENQAAVMQAQAERDQLVLQKQEQDMRAAEANFRKQYDDLEKERVALKDKLQSSEVDPNRLMGNMNFGQRLATAVGMIIGGAGAGILHQENPVVSMMNKAINADIEAQKANLGKQENLLAMNLRQYGNLKDAEQASRLMANDMVLNKLKQSLAMAQGPQAQAQLQQEIAKLEMQQDLTKQKFLLDTSVRTTVEQDPSSFDTVEQQMRLVDPKRADDLRARFVPGMGIASAPEDAKALKEMRGATEATLNGIRKLKDIIARPGKSLSPAAMAEAEAIRGQLTGSLRTALGLGVMNKSDFELIDRMIPDPTAMLSLDSSNLARLKAVTARMNDSLASAATARGINGYSPIKALTPEMKQWYDWAKRHPADPRAQQFLSKYDLD